LVNAPLMPAAGGPSSPDTHISGMPSWNIPPRRAVWSPGGSATPGKGILTGQGDIMRRIATVVLASTALLLALAEAASAQQIRRAEPLLGGNENPPVVTDGTGRFRAEIFNDRIEFRLRYDVAADETPDSDVTQAHLHAANPGVNGGIVVFLCANDPIVTPAPATARECPPSPNTVEGEIVADDVLADADGVLQAGDLEGLARLIRQGAIYVNVHSNDHGSGEVRGQMSPRIR
jgi:CHRD domain